MNKRIGNLKSEFFYLALIVLMTVCFSYFTHTSNYSITIGCAVLGTLLIITWFIRAFALYSGRKISQYSEVIQRISLKDRFFSYFILPVVFYISLLAYIYFNTSPLMDLVLTSIAAIQLFILFLNVKSSFRKVYTISAQTRAIFDFICISMFFLVESVFVRLGLSLLALLTVTLIFSFVILWADLRIHCKGGIFALFMTIVSAILIAVFVGSFWNTNIFVIPAVGTLTYYLVISLWNVRFSGKYKLTDYLLPFLYSVLALILILNL